VNPGRAARIPAAEECSGRFACSEIPRREAQMHEGIPAAETPVRRLTKPLLWIALAAAVLAYPAAYALDRACGKNVVLLAGAAYDERTVKQRRGEFDDSITDPDERRKAVAEIYGPTTKAEVLRVLFVDEGDLIRPVEDKELALLAPAKDGSHRVQTASAYFAAKMTALGAAAAAGVLLLLRRFLK
jgi:hypothetical protein